LFILQLFLNINGLRRDAYCFESTDFSQSNDVCRDAHFERSELF